MEDQLRRKMRVVSLLLLFLFSGSSMLSYAGNSDAVPPWMKQQSGKKVEDRINSASKAVFAGLVFLSVAIGSISFGWGLVEFYGVIGERQEGVKRMKFSIVGIILGILASAVIAWAVSVVT